MEKPYNPDLVVVENTHHSNLRGITHLRVTVPEMASEDHAERLLGYIQEYLGVHVGGIFDPNTGTAVFMCFVWMHFSCDAIGVMQGLLGPQAMKFAFSVQ